jgi:hypothetical protein
VLCDTCRDSHDRYWREAEAKMVNDARLCLESRGYVVVPNERVETLGAQRFETYWTYQSLKDQASYIASINRHLGLMIGGELMASGVLPITKRPGPDNVDGYVFSTKLTIIKPEKQ